VKEAAPEHKDGSLRYRAASGSLQWTDPVLRLQTCPECRLPAVLIPGQGACAPCLTAQGKPIRFWFTKGIRQDNAPR
jgi:hypothetical protein